MRKLMVFVMAMAIIMGLCACGSPKDTSTTEGVSNSEKVVSEEETEPIEKPQESTVIRMGLVEGIENPVGVMATKFKELIETNSNGAITVEIYPSQQLGGVREMVEAVQFGNQEIVVCTPAWVSSFVPQMSALSFPYLFSDRETAHELLDGVVGDELIEYGKDSGFQILGFPEVGYRQVTNSVRPITKLEDFNGIKIRLQGDPVHIATFEALGASPVSMDFSELYSALQQHVVDGQENTTTNIYMNKFTEVQEYLSYTNIFYDAWVICMNKDFYDSLSDDLKTVIQEAADEAVALQREVVAKADEDYAEKLKTEMEVNELEPDEIERIVEITRPVYTEFNDLIGEEFVNKVLEAVEK